jgi:hypothetical protein
MKYRQYATYLITLVFAALFSCANPTEPTSSAFTVTIKGTVVRKNFTALDSVQIILSNPIRRDSAKADGSFLISFTSSEKNAVNATMTFSRTGFYDTTRAITFGSTSKDVDLQIVVMKGLTSAQDSVVTRPSQRPGSVVYIGTSSDNLSILGAGGKDAAILTFEVRDSLGAPVDTANQLNVLFRFINRPDLFTQLNRDSMRTNSSGRVSVQLSSGLKSGLASVQALAGIRNKIDPTLYDTIKSQVVSIPIFGGFPDSAHFSIGSEKYNIPGAVLIGFKDKIKVLVGDKYGNPVRAGTPVIFSSTGGVIDGNAVTTNDGSATVDLTTGNPVPTNGFAWVKAQVATGQGAAAVGQSSTRNSKIKARGDAVNVEAAPKPLANHLSKSTLMKALVGPIISDSIPILFSGRTVVASLLPGFIIPVGSSTTVNFTVSDTTGNPLTSGTTIKVTASGAASSDVELTGDVDLTLPDTQDPKYTAFHVDVKDKRTTGLNQSKKLTLTIDVNSLNGNDKKAIQGDLSGTGGISVDSSIVQRIVLVDPNPDTIFVAGVGGINYKEIQFKVYNKFDLPAKGAQVTFSLAKTLAGGEYLSPGVVVADTGGNAKTTITSGTKFGEVRVVASAKKDSLTLTSDPKVIYIVIPPATRLASQIAYLGATASDIFVAGVGGLENSVISYEVRDSLGIPIDRQRRVFATYGVQFFPNSLVGGGTPPTVIPSTDSTDDSGKLRTTVASGSEAGVVQIVVQIQLPGRPVLVSQPVRISVHAGFADQGHFSLIPSRWVFGGYRLREDIKFTVVVGDTFSNPVQSGTAVYFHSQAGVIQTGSSDFSAYTDPSGLATVALLPVNPTPDPSGTLRAGRPTYDTTLSQGRVGYHWVWAQTQGSGGRLIIDSVLVVQGIAPIIVTGIPDTVVPIASGTRVSVPISITIKDGHGNPAPDGTTISASVKLDNAPIGFQVGVIGDISTDFPVNIPNASYARFPQRGITDFTFRVVDGSTVYLPGVAPLIRITITSPDLGTYTYSFTAKIQ